MLYDQVPAGTVHFGHSLVDFKQSGDHVKVVVEQYTSEQNGHDPRFEVTADLLVAADGSNSTVRKVLVPDDKRRWEMKAFVCDIVLIPCGHALNTHGSSHLEKPCLQTHGCARMMLVLSKESLHVADFLSSVTSQFGYCAALSRIHRQSLPPVRQV